MAACAIFQLQYVIRYVAIVHDVHVSGISAAAYNNDKMGFMRIFYEDAG